MLGQAEKQHTLILQKEVTDLKSQIESLKKEKKAVEDKFGDWMEDDNNAREKLLAQMKEKTDKIEELKKSNLTLCESKTEQSDLEKELIKARITL